MPLLLQPGQRQGEDTCLTGSRKVPPALQVNIRVSPQVNQQRQKLHELQTLIDNLGTGQETVSDKAFEDRLKEAEKAIMELLDEAQTSKGNMRSTSGSETVLVPLRPFLHHHL